jgi:hypothetical protein
VEPARGFCVKMLVEQPVFEPKGLSGAIFLRREPESVCEAVQCGA